MTSEKRSSSHPPRGFFHVMDSGPPVLTAGSQRIPFDERDEALAERLIDSFSHSAERLEARTDSEWSVITEKWHRELISILLSGNQTELAQKLHGIHTSSFLRGMDQSDHRLSQIANNPPVGDDLNLHTHDLLVRFAEALGCIYMEIPGYRDKCENIYISPEEVITRIESTLGIDTSPPPVCDKRFGLKVQDKGIYFVRDVYALYMAYRLRDVCGNDSDKRICEIGGGMGRVAYYCWKLGLRNYTLFDLAQVNAVQGYFLGKALGEENVCLYGELEKSIKSGVRIMPSWSFAELSDQFDVILNTDSMPEMGESIVQEYLQSMKRSDPHVFLSINQESRKPVAPGGPPQAVVSQLVERAGGFVCMSRYPFWLRDGYVEELYGYSGEAA